MVLVLVLVLFVFIADSVNGPIQQTRANEFLFMAAFAADAMCCHFYDNISCGLPLAGWLSRLN